jgi:hypothetical protein
VQDRLLQPFDKAVVRACRGFVRVWRMPKPHTPPRRRP